MTQHTGKASSRKTRAPWGSKRGWQTRGAKFSPEECARMDIIVDQLGPSASIDSFIHDAVTLHLARLSEAA